MYACINYNYTPIDQVHANTIAGSTVGCTIIIIIVKHLSSKSVYIHRCVMVAIVTEVIHIIKNTKQTSAYTGLFSQIFEPQLMYSNLFQKDSIAPS